jgi:hypothetical protein
MSKILTRRDFGKFAITATPLASAALPCRNLLAQAKPNSDFDGVHLGVISYSFNGMPAKDRISAMVEMGISNVELMSNHPEELAGAPVVPFSIGGGRGPQAPAALEVAILRERRTEAGHCRAVRQGSEGCRPMLH